MGPNRKEQRIVWRFNRDERTPGVEAVASVRNADGYIFHVAVPATEEELAEQVMNESLDWLGFTGPREKGRDWQT